MIVIHIHTIMLGHIYIYIYIYMVIYIYTYIYICKNFAWENQRRKRCYIVHIAPPGVTSALLFIYRTGYTYGKELEGF